MQDSCIKKKKRKALNLPLILLSVMDENYNYLWQKPDFK